MPRRVYAQIREPLKDKNFDAFFSVPYKGITLFDIDAHQRAPKAFMYMVIL